MTILLVRIPSAGVLPVVVVTDHGQTLQVRLATQGLVQPPEFDGGVAVVSKRDVVKVTR